jgi:hypothetical protein
MLASEIAGTFPGSNSVEENRPFEYNACAPVPPDLLSRIAFPTPSRSEYVSKLLLDNHLCQPTYMSTFITTLARCTPTK